jgi:starvation-inducible DNA-binding protein
MTWPGTTLDADAIMARATPQTHQDGHELRPCGHQVAMPIALSAAEARESVANLNQILADTVTLRDKYKKHHWQTRT